MIRKCKWKVVYSCKNLLWDILSSCMPVLPAHIHVPHVTVNNYITNLTFVHSFLNS